MQQGVDHQLESYKNMFDENGKFKASMFTQEVPKDDYEVFEATDANSDAHDEVGAEKEYNHIHTPLYTITLQSSYEDNLTGVHGKNKFEHRRKKNTPPHQQINCNAQALKSENR